MGACERLRPCTHAQGQLVGQEPQDVQVGISWASRIELTVTGAQPHQRPAPARLLVGIAVLSAGATCACVVAALAGLGIVPPVSAFLVFAASLVASQILTGAQMNRGDVLRRGRPFIFDLYSEVVVSDGLGALGLPTRHARRVAQMLWVAPTAAFVGFVLVVLALSVK